MKGFTLLEVLLAVTILAIISTLTAVNISKSVKFKNKIEQDLDDYAAVRDALVIITHDINSAFHWIDINGELKKAIQASSASPTPGVAQVVTNGDQVPLEKLTSFIGETESLYFTTLSHVRTIINTKDSDQAKIGYYLKDVKAQHGGKSTKALIRSESIYLDGEPTKGGKESILLENIKSIKFRYMGNDDKEWLERWKSAETDDDSQRNKFPDAVEITISTSRDGRDVTLSTLAAVHNTYNDLVQNMTGGTTPGPGVSPSPPAGGQTPVATPPKAGP